MTTTPYAALAEALTRNLDPTYTLVYVSYDDQLTTEQIDNVVAGDWEKVWESTEEFESDARWESGKQIIAEEVRDLLRGDDMEDVCIHCGKDVHRDADLQADVHDATASVFCDIDDLSGPQAEPGQYDDTATILAGFQGTEEWDEVRYAIEERDDSQWLDQLTANSGRVLLRIAALDEDHAFSYQAVEPIEVIERLNIDQAETDLQHNLAAVEYVLANADPEFSVLMGYWVAGAEVKDIADLPNEDDTEVEIVNPYLYLGNPFAGSGFLSEEPIRTTIRVKRSELRTDRGAFGYSMDDIHGGLNASDFEVELRAVPGADHKVV